MFWRKPKKEAPAVEAPEPIWKSQVAELEAFRKIGEKFNYLGVEMICTGHKRTQYMYMGANYTYAELRAEYVDKHGVIKETTWSFSQFPCVLAENKVTP